MPGRREWFIEWRLLRLGILRVGLILSRMIEKSFVALLRHKKHAMLTATRNDVQTRMQGGLRFLVQVLGFRFGIFVY